MSTDGNEKYASGASRKRKAGALDEPAEPATVAEMETEADSEANSEGVQLPDALHISNSVRSTGHFEAGIILRVRLENFMCHRVFDITLGKKVNFISGQNGSGKSAIVAAIQLCLGASAKRTGRGDSLSMMIREGSKQPAVVSVTLRNVGVDAYKHSEYGDAITVERKIARAGSSGYRLIAADGRTVSTEKRELERMLKTFNIFIDNPCCVLTQEESKKFIQGHEKDKYQFFLKATGLHRIKEELDSTEALNLKTEMAQKISKVKLREKFDALNKLKEELEELLQLDKYDDEIAATTAKLFWFEVKMSKNVTKKCVAEIKKAKDKYANAENKLIALKRELESLGTVDDSKAARADIQSELATSVTELAECQNKIHTASRNVGEKQVATNRINNNIKELSNRMSSCNKQMKKINDDALRRAEAGERVLIERIEDISSRLSIADAELAATKERKKAAQLVLSDIDNEFGKQEYRVRGLSDQINQKKSTLSRMKSANKENRVEAFGARLPGVMQDIKKERFKGAVFGPIGMELSLSDRLDPNQASPIVERYIGGMMKNFLCSESEDRAALQRILRRHNCFKEHSVILSPRMPRINVNCIPGALTVLDLVSVKEEHALIYNALVDLANLDKIVVAQNEEEVFQLFVELDSQRKECFKRGISKAVTIDEGNEVTYRFGNRMSDPNYEQCRHLLAGDSTESIRSIAQEIEHDIGAVKREEAILSDLLLNRQNADKNCKGFNLTLQKLTTDITSLVRDKRILEDKLEDARQQNDDDTTALEAEIEEIRVNIASQNVYLQDETRLLDEAKAEENDLKKEKESLDRKKAVLTNRMRENEIAVEKFLEQVALMEKRIRESREQLSTCEVAIKTVEEALDGAKEAENKSEKEAVNQTANLIPDWNGAPLELVDGETTDSLNKKIFKLKESQDTERLKIGLSNRTKACVSSELSSGNEDFKAMKDNYDAIRHEWEASCINVENRRAAWQAQLKRLQKVVSKNFDIYMQKKSFAGTVKFNHEEKTLHLKTQTDSSDSHTQCSDVRQLSGGERSYTTLCLLLALGMAIECPFRVMDEYDVFLDQLSRKLTLVNIQDYALSEEQAGRQFIIVTPNDLKGMVRSRNVQHFFVAAPERRFGSANAPVQTALDDFSF